MRTMDVEALLRWAYRDELPKSNAKLARPPVGVASGWGKIESYAQLLTLIDPNRYGVVPDLFARSEPHPDAVAVAEAVALLDGLELGVPEGWTPFADIQDAKIAEKASHAAVQALDFVACRDREGKRVLRHSVSRLVIKHAILGGSPDWQGEDFEIVSEKGPFGKPAWFRTVLVGSGREAREVEIDGWDVRRRRPMPDAYQRTYLDPDAKPVAIGRAEYELWHSALAFLVEELAAMDEHRATPSPRPARPWETGDIAPDRVLRDLTEPLTLVPQKNRRRPTKAA